MRLSCRTHIKISPIKKTKNIYNEYTKNIWCLGQVRLACFYHGMNFYGLIH